MKGIIQIFTLLFVQPHQDLVTCHQRNVLWPPEDLLQFIYTVQSSRGPRKIIHYIIIIYIYIYCIFILRCLGAVGGSVPCSRALRRGIEGGERAVHSLPPKLELVTFGLRVRLSWIWLPLTTTAHHPWTTSPIMHCTHTFPSTITSITQLSPFTHQPWLPHHTCTSFTHSHKSSTQTLTQCEVLFFPWLTFQSVFPSLSSRVLPGLLTPSPDCLLPASLTLPAFW